MVYQLKYDSVHKTFAGTVACKEADGKEFLAARLAEFGGVGFGLGFRLLTGLKFSFEFRVQEFQDSKGLGFGLSFSSEVR